MKERTCIGADRLAARRMCGREVDATGHWTLQSADPDRRAAMMTRRRSAARRAEINVNQIRIDEGPRPSDSRRPKSGRPKGRPMGGGPFREADAHPTGWTEKGVKSRCCASPRLIRSADDSTQRWPPSTRCGMCSAHRRLPASRLSASGGEEGHVHGMRAAARRKPEPGINMRRVHNPMIQTIRVNKAHACRWQRAIWETDEWDANLNSLDGFESGGL